MMIKISPELHFFCFICLISSFEWSLVCTLSRVNDKKKNIKRRRPYYRFDSTKYLYVNVNIEKKKRFSLSVCLLLLLLLLFLLLFTLFVTPVTYTLPCVFFSFFCI